MTNIRNTVILLLLIVKKPCLISGFSVRSVNNSDETGRPGMRFRRQVKLLTTGRTACSVKGALEKRTRGKSTKMFVYLMRNDGWLHLFF